MENGKQKSEKTGVNYLHLSQVMGTSFDLSGVCVLGGGGGGGDIKKQIKD